VSLVA